MADTSQPILITGGTGFAGSHLIEALQAAGYTNLHTTSLKGGENTTPGVTIHQVDLTQRAAVLDLWRLLQPTQIYHLAAIAATGSSFDQADQLLNNNTTVQLNVLEATRQHSPNARFLAVGSAEEYGLVTLGSEEKVTEDFPFRPINPYAVSKITQELLARVYHQAYGLQIIFARPFNHLGERQTPQFAIASFAQQIAAIEKGHQTTLKTGNLEANRDFTDVKDMVRAYQLLMEKGQVGEVYNIGSGTGYQIGEVSSQLTQLANTPIQIELDPTHLRPLDVPRVIADNGKIAALGWRPTIPMADTLTRVLAYWRNQP